MAITSLPQASLRYISHGQSNKAHLVIGVRFDM